PRDERVPRAAAGGRGGDRRGARLGLVPPRLAGPGRDRPPGGRGRPAASAPRPAAAAGRGRGGLLARRGGRTGSAPAAAGRLVGRRAEVRVPVLAWREVRVRTGGSRTLLGPRALFQPGGLAGGAYWGACRPFHDRVCGGMSRGICRAAEQGHDEAVRPRQG